MKEYVFKVKKPLVLQIIFSTLSTATLAILPYLTKVLFDSLTQKDLRLFLFLISAYILCNLANIFFSYIEMIYSWKKSIQFELNLKKDFFKSIVNYSYKRFSSKDIGEYISLQGNEITQLEMDYLSPLVDIFQAVITLIVYGVIFFVLIDWRIALVMIIASIITLIGPKLTSKRLSEKRKIYLDKMGEYVSKIKDLLEGFKLIKTSTKNNIIDEHEKTLKETSKFRFNYGKYKCISMLINGAFIYFLNITGFLVVAYLLYKNEITIGTAVATLGYLEAFMGPIDRLVYNINTINSTESIKLKVLEFLKMENNIELENKENLENSIKFSGVDVKFNNFTLENFSYEFNKGKKYALIGHSGSGKSTIINSLMKYVDLSGGEILIDDKNINEIDTDKMITCINQYEHIFATDLKNNATVFDSYNFKSLNMLLGTLDKQMIKCIEEKQNSQQLSGGEKQVISFMRMLLSNSEVLVMDEIFSATDMNTSKRLQDMLMSITDKTMIMITHKLSEELACFDEILIMNNGKLIESGSYEDISKSQVFKSLKAV